MAMNGERNHEMGLVPRTAIFISCVLILCNYYYLYAFDFAQGNTSGSGALAVIRVCAIVLLCSQFFLPKLRMVMRLEEVGLLLFLVFGMLVILFKRLVSDVGDFMFVNTLVCAAPLLLLRAKGGEESKEIFRFFLESCLFIILVQVFADFIIYLYGFSLWDNKAFIGGVGNPSSFGIICNIFLAYVLLLRKRTFYSVFAFFVLVAGILMTNSMLPALMLGLVVSIWGARRSKFKFIMLCLVAIVLLSIFQEYIISEHLRYKIHSALGLIGGVQESSSASVSIRVQIHGYYAESVAKDVLGFLFYGFSENFYKGVDSQIITYLSSFGLFISLLFFVYSAVSFFRALFLRVEERAFLSVAIFLFIIAFATNRILDYYPMALFFFLFCVTAASTLTGCQATTVLESAGDHR